jgi:glucan phosphoethanolaminetransferase (alkaline phosphatase superfamily)
MGHWYDRWIILVFMGIYVMIYGLYTMSGGIFSLSGSFGRPGGWLRGYGGVLSLYVVIGLITITVCCVLFLTVQLMVARVVALLVCNSVLCLLIYFYYENKPEIPP